MAQQTWRFLEEHPDQDQVPESVADEFPTGAYAWDDPTSRRDFLRMMAASFGLAGLAGCGELRQPEEPIVPYVLSPEHAVPGQPQQYATAMPFSGGGIGLLVECHDGRPTKIEGNPTHPASLGATDIFAQATILDLYDPDRSQTVQQHGQISSWDSFYAALKQQLDGELGREGSGLRILTEPVLSPTLAAQLEELLKRFPQAKWHQYEPLHRDFARAGAIAAFGQDLVPRYHIDRADVILAIDADVFGAEAGHVRYAHDFAQRRRPEVHGHSMNRLYAVEPTPSLTGAVADHRLVLAPHEIAPFVREVAARLGDAGPSLRESFSADMQRVLDAVVSDLKHAGAKSLVLTGRWQSPEVHTAVHVINAALGNAGETVEYLPPLEASPVDQTRSLRELVDAMQSGQAQTLIVLAANPVFHAPPGIGFLEAFRKVPFRVHCGEYADETAAERVACPR